MDIESKMKHTYTLDVVYKYPLKYDKIVTLEGIGSSWDQEQIIDLPANSEILKVDLQGENLVLWARVDSKSKITHKVLIEIVGTGHQLKNDLSEYLNTFYDGGLVFHVFVYYGYEVYKK